MKQEMNTPGLQIIFLVKNLIKMSVFCVKLKNFYYLRFL